MRNIVAIEHNSPPRDSLVKVEWNLSKRCNFDCSYCSVNTHDHTSSFPDWTSLQRTVETLAAIPREVRIGITGGEPTICPDFLRLLKLIKEKGISFVSVTTNGSRGTRYFMEALDYLDGIVFSLHFEYLKNQEILKTIIAAHKKLAGFPLKRMHVHLMMLPGHFDQANEAMRILRAEGIEFALRTIRPTYQRTESGEHIQVRPYGKPGKVRTSGAKGPDYSHDGDFYSPEEHEWLESHMHKASFFNAVTILEDQGGVCMAVQENVNDYLANSENRYLGWKCFSGIHSLFISPDGVVFNASCRVKRLGTVSDGFSVPNSPVECTRDFCTCAADLNTLKVKDPKYLQQTRSGGS